MRLLLIGNLAAAPRILGGQHIRTRLVADYLAREFGEKALVRLDLSQPLPLLLAGFFARVFRCDQVVLLGGPRSLTVFVLLLALCGRLRRTTLVAIGGWLGDRAAGNALLRRLVLPGVAHIFVETATIRAAVQAQVPAARLSLLPNFRAPVPCPPAPSGRFRGQGLRLVFLSRLCRSKGLYLAIHAVEALRAAGEDVTLDLYGPRESDAGAELDRHLSPAIRDHGPLPPAEVLQTLQHYDVLLFPSFYPGEGFAGVLSEALLSATPVICSDWRSNPEVVRHGETGLVVPTGDSAALAGAIAALARDRAQLQRLSQNARRAAQALRPEDQAQPLRDHIAALAQQGAAG